MRFEPVIYCGDWDFQNDFYVMWSSATGDKGATIIMSMRGPMSLREASNLVNEINDAYNVENFIRLIKAEAP